MRRFIPIFTLLVFLFSPIHTLAQSEVKFDSAVIQLWPEFDKPQMLVINEFILSSSVSLPRDIDFKIPLGVTIHVVAVGSTQDTVTDQGITYDTKEENGWLIITVKNINAAAIRIEYYDQLNISGSNRHYVYQWPGDYPTNSLSVIFQQPVDSSNLVIVPTPTGSTTDSNSLVYYEVDFQSVSAGQTEAVTAEYQKSSDRLSASESQVQPANSLTNNIQGQVALPANLPVILVGGAGLILIIAGLVIGLNYFRGGKKKSQPRMKHKSSQNDEKEETTYCHVCGHRVQPGDQFCRACGTRLNDKR